MHLPSFFLASALCLAPRLASAQTPPRPEPPLVETARLHVDAPPFTRVLGRPGADAAWTQVCSAPCDAPVPIDWEYMLQARGIRTSRTFRLDAYEDESVVVHLHPAYTAWVVAGGVAAGSGGGVAAARRS